VGQESTLDVKATPLKLSTKKKKVNIALTVNFTIGTDDGSSRPARLQGVKFLFPQYARANTAKFPTCSPTILETKTPADCPKGSKIGKGSAKANAEPLLPSVPATVDVFNGTKKGGLPTIIFFAKADSLSVQFVIPATLKKTPGKYGYVLDVSIPDLTTLPGQPFAAVTDFTTTIKAQTKKKGKKINFIDAPTKCPSGGFPFQSTFTYEGGSSNVVDDTIACPK